MSGSKTPAQRLRILADWFDMFDGRDNAGKAALLADGPGQRGVQADLRSIAQLLPKGAGLPAGNPDIPTDRGQLLAIAEWFDQSPLGRYIIVYDKGDSAVQRGLRQIADRLERRH
jgi:hypothetical protein